MSDEYTPTDDDVIRDYRMPVAVMVPRQEGESLGMWLSRQSVNAFEHQMASEAAIRRWLAAHDRELRAQALEDAARDWHILMPRITAAAWLSRRAAQVRDEQ